MLQRLPAPSAPDAELRYFFVALGTTHKDDLLALIALLHPEPEWAHYRARLAAIAAAQRIFSHADIAINGDDLQQIGYREGVMIGKCKEAALRYLCRHPERNNRAALIAFARSFLADEGRSDHESP